MNSVGPPLGVDPVGKMRLRISNKQTNKLLLGGKFYKFFMTVALAIPPLTVKNRPCALIRSCGSKSGICIPTHHECASEQ